MAIGVQRLAPVFGEMTRLRSIEPSRSSVFNPKGIASFSPGLARLREGLPWVPVIRNPNPERVAARVLEKLDATLSGLWSFIVPALGSLALLRQGYGGEATLGLVTQSLRDWKHWSPRPISRLPFH